jgi:hypothetical protein
MGCAGLLRSRYPVAIRSMLGSVFLGPKHRRFRLLAVTRGFATCVVVGVCVAGCGSSYTRADFIQRADGICTGATRDVRLLKPPEFAAGSEAQQRSSAEYLQSAASIVRREAIRLTGLPKPPETAAQRRLRVSWLAAAHASATDLRALASATAAGDTAAATAANAKLAANPVVKLAAQYGARACAGPGATYK